MQMRVVVKVSKLCNLRCTYCYETPELARKDRMSLGDIERMFVHVRDYLWQWSQKPSDHVLQFIWHGGEPFAQPLSYWEDIADLQRQVYGARFQRGAIVNSVQTNLTLVTEKHLPLLREFFRVGFSYDVINDRRVNVAGAPTGETVEKKVEWLLSERIPMGAVAVISKSNVDNPRAVASYFVKRHISFRALHLFYALDSLPGTREAAVPFDASLGFYKAMYDMPDVQESMREIAIEPLAQAKSVLDGSSHGGRPSPSKKTCRETEWALGVNTNGDVYSHGDMYFPEFCYGNIFSQSFEEFLTSDGRKRRVEKSRRRLETICEKWPFYRKGCSGRFVSHATPEEYREFERIGMCHYAWIARVMQETSAHRSPAR
jgi:uncharacterized protein